ncbi:hypothetical protein [Pseudomonas sp. CC120222-01a]|uniref:hypothetical protein n=1 Tax=Pseudomonas sp. CC120222-01a TaxID=1378075 RepID=UPI00130537A4|nr:hypothetical protein [Pseudomonas sp. CC120222-01a]
MAFWNAKYLVYRTIHHALKSLRCPTLGIMGLFTDGGGFAFACNDAPYHSHQLGQQGCPGAKNDWQSTPKVRISVLDPTPGHQDTVNRVVDAWPPSDYAHEKMYLCDDMTMSKQLADRASTVNYQVEKGAAVFRNLIESECELVGYMKLRYGYLRSARMTWI